MTITDVKEMWATVIVGHFILQFGDAAVYEACCLCGEKTSENDVAEMYDASEIGGIGGICHPQCGLDAGWEIS